MTLLREHCQGPNAMLYTLPTGGFDPRKSPSALAAAHAELSEEVCVAPELPALQCYSEHDPVAMHDLGGLLWLWSSCLQCAHVSPALLQGGWLVRALPAPLPCLMAARTLVWHESMLAAVK